MTLNDAYVELDGNDLSAFFKSVTLKFQVETDDDARMGDDTAKVVATRENWSFDGVAVQDYTPTTGIDSIVWPIIKAKAAVTLRVRPTSAAKSTTNPEYTGSVYVVGWDAISGPHGKQPTSPLPCVPAGDLTRATA